MLLRVAGAWLLLGGAIVAVVGLIGMAGRPRAARLPASWLEAGLSSMTGGALLLTRGLVSSDGAQVGLGAHLGGALGVAFGFACWSVSWPRPLGWPRAAVLALSPVAGLWLVSDAERGRLTRAALLGCLALMALEMLRVLVRWSD